MTVAMAGNAPIGPHGQARFEIGLGREGVEGGGIHHGADGARRPGASSRATGGSVTGTAAATAWRRPRRDTGAPGMNRPRVPGHGLMGIVVDVSAAAEGTAPIH